MKLPFKKGDMKQHQVVVTKDDIAQFSSGVVHEVYSTFALCRDAEWSGRLFVLEMKEAGEEGIGTAISINHHGPAFVQDVVVFTATFEEVRGNGEIVTSFKATVGERMIASGMQHQRILPKEKIETLFSYYQQ